MAIGDVRVCLAFNVFVSSESGTLIAMIWRITVWADLAPPLTE